jgi:hypothetical protein
MRVYLRAFLKISRRVVGEHVQKRLLSRRLVGFSVFVLDKELAIHVLAMSSPRGDIIVARSQIKPCRHEYCCFNG